MNPSVDFETPDHFTAGAVGRPGERVFYLQARQQGALATFKCEKEQVGALAEHLATVLERFPVTAAELPTDVALLEPITPLWSVGAIGVGYDEDRDRVLIVVNELAEEVEGEGEEEEGEEESAEAEAAAPEPAEETSEESPAAETDQATARFLLTRPQIAAFVERARRLIRAGRPICPMCSQPQDPGGHVCPRANGHVAGRA